jgi:hypothetical protein
MVGLGEHHEAVFHIIQLIVFVIVVRFFFHCYSKTKLFGPRPTVKVLTASPAVE